LTVGIISATQRDINAGPYDDFLQTDAAINKGNSGGPLFNMEGEVIGVNTAIISPTGGSIGIGFAVPSDSAQMVINQLRDFGETRRGWLGVRIQTVTDDIAETLGLAENSGALVSAVTTGSPAAEAGIEVGDLILKFDGKDVTRMRGLPRLVAQATVGKPATLEIVRKGQKKSVDVVLGLLSEDEEKIAPPLSGRPSPNAARPGGPGTNPPLMGLSLVPLTDEVRQRFGISSAIKGLLVTEVDPSSPAAENDIVIGDVIVEAAQEPVSNEADLAKRIASVEQSGGPSILLRVEDGKGGLRFVAVPLR
jgi:serine protease Do